MFQVQCWHGFPDKLRVGAGFRISDGSSTVSQIKYADRWNPFVDLEDDEEIWGDKYGVCTKPGNKACSWLREIYSCQALTRSCLKRFTNLIFYTL